jgi:hypothetical protein
MANVMIRGVAWKDPIGGGSARQQELWLFLQLVAPAEQLDDICCWPVRVLAAYIT